MMFSFLPAHIIEAIRGDLHEEARLHRAGRLWVWWQLTRSIWPLIARAAEREGTVNVALWFLVGYFAFAVPVLGLGAIRDFILVQVPLRTDADPGPVWISLLMTFNLAGFAFGSWLALKRMGRHL